MRISATRQAGNSYLLVLIRLYPEVGVDIFTLNTHLDCIIRMLYEKFHKTITNLSWNSSGMRTEDLQYSCEVRKNNVELCLENWPVAGYPISFTTKECLEEFCYTAGWEFLGYLT